MSEWQTVKLEDCLETLIDYRGKTPEKKSFGIPLITAKIVKGGRIETPQEFISPDDYDSWMRREGTKCRNSILNKTCLIRKFSIKPYLIDMVRLP